VSVSPRLELRTLPQKTEAFLNEISEHYTFEIQPEYRLKARYSFPRVTLGVNYEPVPKSLEFTIKPGWKDKNHKDGHKPWWQQILITPDVSDVRLFTNKVPIGPLNLQLVVGHDFTTNKTGVRWRMTAPWEGMFKKQQYKRACGPLEAGFVWDFQQTAPSVGGSVGIDDDPFAMDFGGLSFALARVQLAARFGGPPGKQSKHRGIASVAKDSEEEEEVEQPKPEHEPKPKHNKLTEYAARLKSRK
jgi:hypothetical protein